MKIIHAVCTDAFAGVERHVAMLAAAECDRGHDVTVAGGRPDIMRAMIDRPGVRHLAAPTVGAMAVTLARQRAADVVNVHMTEAEIAAALAWPWLRVPVVATRHFAATRGQSSRPAAFVARWAARRLSAQIAVSQFVAAHVEGPSAVVISGVASWPDRPVFDREKIVLVAQRLEVEKRTEDAIRVFAESHLAAAGWVMQVAGDGQQRRHLERLAEAAGVEGVRFLGQRRDVDQLMSRAAVLLAPRTDEALGLTVLEAMSHRLPVIAAGAGGHVETVGSVCPELLYPPGDLGSAAELLSTLAQDSDRRSDLGKLLQDAQRKQFSIEAQAVATEVIYRSVL